ncbi:MAG: alpha/beta fold hydrolase [Eubacteriales bacterium]
MSTKRDFSYPSSDNITTIHAIEWIPDGEVRAVVQILHGMVEFVDRYDRFARFLNEHGIYVTGNDHLGHGASVISDDSHGYFARENGNLCVIKDIHELRQMTEKKYPGVPYFMLGHSMGSFLLRQYITMHGEGLTGVILSGTGYTDPGLLNTVMGLCRVKASVQGWDHRSRTIDRLALGSYNKAFEPARTKNDWLTKDEAIVDAYNANPWNNFMFTLNGYYNLFKGLKWAEDEDEIEKIPKTLPILLASGKDDPVGNNGEGPEKVADSYRKAGIKNVTCVFYPGDRHEILNELDHDKVDRDFLSFIETEMKKAAKAANAEEDK